MACEGGAARGMPSRPSSSRKERRGCSAFAEHNESAGSVELNILHAEEHLRRIQLVAFDVLLDRTNLQCGVHENPGRVIQDQLLCLIVKRRPLGWIGYNQ